MLDEGPVNTFLEMAMNGEYWKAEQVPECNFKLKI
jgi:hypothetical protein